MKRNFLKELGIEDSIIDQIMDENGKDINTAKADLESITSERDSLKAQLEDYDKQISDLKKSAGDNEELKAQITALQKENSRTKVEFAIEKALATAGSKNHKAVRALLNIEKAEFNDDGTIKGLADQIKALKTSEDSSFLFKTEEAPKPITPQITGATPAEPGDQKPKGISKSDFNRMGYSQRAELYENDPDTYNALMNA